MKNVCLKWVLIGILSVVSFSVFAQSKISDFKVQDKVAVKMKNGTEYVGFLSEKTEEYVLLTTENGEIKLVTENIKSIKSDAYSGKYAYAHPDPSRYFFSSSAIPVSKGKWLYKNQMLSLNGVEYGITKNISLHAGFDALNLILGRQVVLFVEPRAGFKVANNLHLGVGGLVVSLINEETAGMVYGKMTVGSHDANVSIGGGYITDMDDGFLDFAGGFVNLAGAYRVSRSIALVSENYLIPINEGVGYMGTHGIKILSRKNVFNLGVMLVEGTPILPNVGYTRVF